MSSMSNMVDCFEISEKGIRAVSVSFGEYWHRTLEYWCDIKIARSVRQDIYRVRSKPRVPPRTAVGVVMSQ